VIVVVLEYTNRRIHHDDMTPCWTYTLDCLTDGSEQSGPPSLFLSVYKGTLGNDEGISLTDELADRALCTRYALGLGDVLSRAAADQRFKLHKVGAVFASSPLLLGLPSLLLHLTQAGQPRLHLIVAHCDDKESFADMLSLHVQRQHHPQVQLCHLTEYDSWWKVLQHDFVIAYALQTKTGLTAWFLVLRKNESDHVTPAILVLQGRAPAEAWSDLPKGNYKLLCVLCTNEVKVNFDVPIIRVAPQEPSRLLHRAFVVSSYLHSQLPRLFPWNASNTTSSNSRTDWTLCTGTSIVLTDKLERVDRIPLESVTTEMAQQQWEHIQQVLVNDSNEIDLEDEENNTGIRDLPSWLFLGTGCASPSPHRGASGHCLVLSDGMLVFEVGEGFLTQFMRHAPSDVTQIRFVWISHAHWDHYGGLVNLLVHMEQARAQAPLDRKRKIEETWPPTIVVPPKVHSYLKAMLGSNHKILERCHTHTNAAKIPNFYESVMIGDKSRIESWQDVAVNHGCANAHGFCMAVHVRDDSSKDTKIYRIVFSGDTTACKRLVQTSQRMYPDGVDLLVHEATFVDTDQHLAETKKHSTTCQALFVAEKMKAQRVVLSHFSQRYNKLSDIPQQWRGRVLLAWDGFDFPSTDW